MASKTCDWRMVDDEAHEYRCGKPAVGHLTWPHGKMVTYYYCAEHYDKRVKFVRDCNRLDVLKESGIPV